MNKKEIADALSLGESRFEFNNQLSLEEAVEILSALPVQEMVADGSYLAVKTSRPLTASEAFRLAQLRADSPEEILDEQTSFRLWWD